MRPCFFFTSATSDFTAVGGTSIGRDHLDARHILTGCCDSLRIRTGVDLVPVAVNSFASVMRSLDMRGMGVTSRLQRLTAPCDQLPNSEANGHLDDRQIKGND